MNGAAVDSSEPALLLLVGLTGAGKSTTLAALHGARPGLRALPDRRRLADEVVLPEAQRLQGSSVGPVRDRLERFRLTARYRQAHPGGLAHALTRVLPERSGVANDDTWVFDNLRGVDEVAFALTAFPTARFVVLECDAATRIARLAGRADAFDRIGPPQAGANAASTPSIASVAEESDLRSRLARASCLTGSTDLQALATALAGLEPEAVETAIRVVDEESRYYDPDAAWAVLQPLPEARRIRLDTARWSPAEIAAHVAAWL